MQSIVTCLIYLHVLYPFSLLYQSGGPTQKENGVSLELLVLEADKRSSSLYLLKALHLNILEHDAINADRVTGL